MRNFSFLHAKTHARRRECSRLYRAIAAGRFRDAYNLIRKENPFPAVCGRVYTSMRKQVQEGAVDEPLAVADLKRFAADYVMKHEEPYSDLVFPKK